jgi:hypothetical protein
MHSDTLLKDCAIIEVFSGYYCNVELKSACLIEEKTKQMKKFSITLIVCTGSVDIVVCVSAGLTSIKTRTLQ